MVANWSTRQTDGLVTDGEALSLARSVNCWKGQYERTLSQMCWGCPKGATGFHKGAIGLPPPARSTHPAPFEQFTFLAQILPPLFAVMAKQMPDSEVESPQLFPSLHGSIGPH